MVSGFQGRPSPISKPARPMWRIAHRICTRKPIQARDGPLQPPVTAFFKRFPSVFQARSDWQAIETSAPAREREAPRTPARDPTPARRPRTSPGATAMPPSPSSSPHVRPSSRPRPPASEEPGDGSGELAEAALELLERGGVASDRCNGRSGFFLEAAPPALRLPPQSRGDSDSDTVSIRSQSPSERAAYAAIAVRACHPRPSCSAATVPAQASGRLRVHASAPHSRRPCSTPTAFPARFLLGGDGAGSTCTGPAALPPRSHLNRPRRLRSLPSTPRLLLCSTARAAALLRLLPLSRG